MTEQLQCVLPSLAHHYLMLRLFCLLAIADRCFGRQALTEQNDFVTLPVVSPCVRQRVLAT